MKRDDGWEVGAPHEARLDTATLDAMTTDLHRGDNYRNVHALLIVKNGRLVYEQYLTGEDRRWRGGEIASVSLDFHPDTLHDSRSVGKSLTSALVGIALGSGAISSLDASVVDFFPEHASLATPANREITFRDALTMSAGLDWNEADVPYTDSRNDETRMNGQSDPVRFVLDREVVAKPGSAWYYNGGLPLLLGVAVSRAVEMPLGEYAREVLFRPLGITDVEWGSTSSWTGVPELRWDSPRGWAQVVHPAGNVWLRPRDLAKFGYLFLNDGRWNGQQVLPPGWALESTRWRFPAGLRVNDQGKYGYGYFWWHDVYSTKQGDLEVHTAAGNGGQRVYVIPSLDLLVVVLAGGYNDPESFWMPERLLLDYIVPAARGEPTG
ncbi:MAG TPA: serine hydrolase [Longimicrobiales bacterium]|nr:serine hydrolase [Longimicrobiales bacterium]